MITPYSLRTLRGWENGRESRLTPSRQVAKGITAGGLIKNSGTSKGGEEEDFSRKARQAR